MSVFWQWVGWMFELLGGKWFVFNERLWRSLHLWRAPLINSSATITQAWSEARATCDWNNVTHSWNSTPAYWDFTAFIFVFVSEMARMFRFIWKSAGKRLPRLSGFFVPAFFVLLSFVFFFPPSLNQEGFALCLTVKLQQTSPISLLRPSSAPLSGDSLSLISTGNTHSHLYLSVFVF